MSEEEKKAIEYFKSNLEMTKEMGKKWGFQEEIKNNEIILNLIERQHKENEKLKEIIKSIRHELKGNIISQDEEGNYRPAKNLRKQEVYESYVKLNLLLKANYIFKEDEDVINELLEE